MQKLFIGQIQDTVLVRRKIINVNNKKENSQMWILFYFGVILVE